MQGKVIQFNATLESHWPPPSVWGPHMGEPWTFIRANQPDGEMKATTTDGKVDYIDWENGVIMTDAGEILIRG